MTSEQFVKTIHPNAEARFQSPFGWAIFFSGAPHCLGPKAGMSNPDVFSTNGSKSSAWVNARKHLQKQGEVCRKAEVGEIVSSALLSNYNTRRSGEVSDYNRGFELLEEARADARNVALEEAACIADYHWPESGHVPHGEVSCAMTISIMIRRLKAPDNNTQEASRLMER